MSFKKLIAAFVLTASAISLASCSPDNKTITIVASPSPHAQVLNDAIKPLIEKQGYKLEINEVTDYVTPNKLVDDGSAFANYFQHEPYLLQFNQDNNTHEVGLFGVHYEPFGIFAGKSKTIEAVPEKGSIGVPNDPTNEARALNLLQAQGLITLKEGVGLKATKADITSNPKNLEIQELAAEALAKSLDSLDLAVINGNYALQNNLGEAIAYEDASSQAAIQYVNVVAVKEGNENDPRAKALETAFQDPSVKTYFETKFKGGAIYNFLPKDQLYKG